MTAKLKLATPTGYHALNPQTVVDYLAGFKKIASKLGGKQPEWQSREVGDGNLNLVFIIEGPKGTVVVKQALPYVRLVGESWPLPLSRAHFEHLALVEEAKWAAGYVPEIYAHDELMALTVMEYLSPHIILRKGLIRGITYPKMAEHLGKFLAQTLFHTSDLHLPAAEKKEKIAAFLTNTAMCKISEDLIFDEPYFNAPMNRNTKEIDDIALEFRHDTELKLAVQDMKWRFQNNAEAMIHGDLHTGSVMVTEDDTRAIDPEFAFYGPMGFDVGAVLANLFMAYFSQEGHEKSPGERQKYAKWVLQQAETLWQTFADEFAALSAKRNPKNPGGDVLNPRLYEDSPDLSANAYIRRMEKIWDDTLGFAGCKMIRRILGLAHVEDFEAIENTEIRAKCERKALEFARELLVHREKFKTISDVTKAIK
ncbi:MAG: S-methyl-5-thioribose kinase [Alphaproteobacteria bacterium]|jgi:5-methylthioribose kinase|nr:S-methyl-5-thioribose kinase [Alphaproteobacteria bacterium]